KGAAYYLHNRLFHLKMGLFILVLLLELMPMLTFMRWRIALAREEAPNLASVKTLYTLNHIEVAIVVIIVFVASFMARGFGLPRRWLRGRRRQEEERPRATGKRESPGWRSQLRAGEAVLGGRGAACPAPEFLLPPAPPSAPSLRLRPDRDRPDRLAQLAVAV